MADATVDFRSSLLAVSYDFRGQAVPPRLTMTQRLTFLRGLGIPTPQASVFAVQDRASSLASVLAHLVEKSGDGALIAQAEQAIHKWNAECDEFLRFKG